MKRWLNYIGIFSFFTGLALLPFSILMPWMELRFTAMEPTELYGYQMPQEVTMIIVVLTIIALGSIIQSRMSSSRSMAGWGLTGSGIVSMAYTLYLRFHPEILLTEESIHAIKKDFSFGIYMPVLGGLLFIIAGVFEFTRKEGRVRRKRHSEGSKA